MKLKHIIFCFVFFLSLKSFSQELNVGVNTGLLTDRVSSLFSSGGSFYVFSFGVAFEHRPTNAIFSLNNDPYFCFNRQKLIFTEPIYLKLILGNKLRVCPSVGVYFRSNFNYGWFYGAHFDYGIKDKFIIFLNGDFSIEYYKQENPRRYVYRTSEPWFMLSFGIKKNIRFKSNKQN